MHIRWTTKELENMCLKIYNTRGMQVPYKSDNMVITQIYNDNATPEEHDLVVDVPPCEKPMLHSLRFLPLFIYLFIFYLFILPPETYLQCVYIGKITIDTRSTWRGSPKETIGLIWIELPQQRMSSYLDLFNCNGGKLRIQTHVTHTRHRKFLGEKE